MKQSTVRIAQVAFIAAAAALAYSFVASSRDGEVRKACTSLCSLAPAYAGNDRFAPDIELRSVDGAPMRLSDLRGQTVVLVFWTTTCSSCKQQMPALAKLAKLMTSDSHMAMMTVAVDDSPRAVREVLLRHTGSPNPFPVVLDPESEFVLGRYGTRAFPETWLIDPYGTIRARFDGARDWSSPIALELLQGISKGTTCPVSIDKFMASGAGANACREAMN